MLPEPGPRISSPSTTISYDDNNTDFGLVCPSPSVQDSDIELPPYPPPPSYPSSVAFPAHRGSDTKRPPSPSPRATEEGQAQAAPAAEQPPPPSQRRRIKCGCCQWLCFVVLLFPSAWLFTSLGLCISQAQQEGGGGKDEGSKNGSAVTSTAIEATKTGSMGGMVESLELGEAVDGMGG
ncbi:hypothetical protein AC579_3896 [Pseudocercospora musae]|uniref:Uncharacterized protein n=1 Tax=Pseudocercospora musae TaxID=113226 RepID=A0A139I357_9PEZI|nr:hypothetical protein AC579_3896 [Pseudocercospora musae]